MSVYKTYDADQIEEVNSRFLISSWSYSKVTSFARNEKAFEMTSIFGLYGRDSATSIAGSAYHKALEYYFTQRKAGVGIDLPELEASAFAEIACVPANKWKLSKTLPSVTDCLEKCYKTTTLLLRNFYGERSLYEDDIEEVLDVEVYCNEYLTINGVDIPLPCHAKIDLVIRTKSGKRVIIDHKSKSTFSSEDEMAMSIGEQAITYVLCYEAKTGLAVDEVWFIENKYSQNKDKSSQLNRFIIEINTDVRRLYEALLYEPLRKMIQATSDPDYVYVINHSDNYVDRAELYDFWCRTMISEVDDFNVEETKKELVAQRLRKIRDASMTSISTNVIRTFKNNASKFIQYDLSNMNMSHEEKIEHVLRSHGTVVRVAHKFEGYSSNTYLLEVSAGVKITSIYSHQLDIANALDVSNVRISKDLVIHESKSYVAVDFAKKRDSTLYWDSAELKGLRIPVGKDNYGNVIYWDLDNHSTPHVLVCGATGSGKSVMVKCTIEYALEAGIREIIILDPKYEFTQYAGRPGIKVFNDIIAIEEAMADLVEDMNERVRTQQSRKTLVIFDEFADAVASSRKGNELIQYEDVQVGQYADGRPKFKRERVGELKSLEENQRVLLQKGRSTGFRILAATQRASVKVITGDAKVNFPVQICFRVPKEADSRVVLDEAGAEALAGMGDGLIKSPEYNDTVRFQAYYFDSSKTAKAAKAEA